MLGKLLPEARCIADTDLLLELQPEDERFRDYQEAYLAEVDLKPLEDALTPLRGKRLSARDDGTLAGVVREALAIQPRQAAESGVWWWLSAYRFPDVSRARWLDENGRVSVDRMLGPNHRNAFARLWWGAEMVRGLEPAYVERLFRNQDLFEAVIGRRLGRSPWVLGVILDCLHDKPGKTARETVRDFLQILSTVALESMPPERVRDEISRLYSVRARASEP